MQIFIIIFQNIKIHKRLKAGMKTKKYNNKNQLANYQIVKYHIFSFTRNDSKLYDKHSIPRRVSNVFSTTNSPKIYKTLHFFLNIQEKDSFHCNKLSYYITSIYFKLIPLKQKCTLYTRKNVHFRNTIMYTLMVLLQFS